MAELTFEQRQAVERPHVGLVLMAGAGSGKTTVLVERYLRSLAVGMAPSEILTVTFTNAAAAEMRDRIAKRLRDRGDSRQADRVEMSSQMGTLHSFCFNLLSSVAEAQGLPAPTEILTEEKTARIFEQQYAKLLFSGVAQESKALLSKFSLPELHNLFWAAFQKRHLLETSLDKSSQDGVPFFAEFGRLFDLLNEAMAQATVAQGCYGFDDLEAKALKVLRANRETPLMALKMILVDEFQDLSPSQWKIISELAQGDGNRLFLVGDPKQSIYGFRGADVRIFDQGTRCVLDAGGETVELTYNFRSSREIVTYLNQVSPPLFDGTGVPFTSMESGRNDEPMGSQARTLFFCEKQLKEEDLLAEEVGAQIADGVPTDEIAILFRASLRIGAFSDALKLRGIAVRTTQAISALRCPAIVDTMAYFKFLTNPHDDMTCAEFLRSSYVALNESDLEAITLGAGESLFLAWASAKPESIRWVVRLFSEGHVGVEKALTALFSQSKYWPTEEAFWSWVGELPTQARLDEVVEGWESLKRLDLTPRFAPGSSQTGVTLTTVHGAKGLEYQSVYLVDLARSSPPAFAMIRSDENSVGFRFRGEKEKVSSPEFERLADIAKAREAQESKRLLYVALTRAKNQLTLLLPKDKKLPKGSWGELISNLK